MKNVMSRSHRSALAEFRCGVAPIRLGTSRYEQLPVDQRLCPLCDNCVEDECHVILKCPVYDIIRPPLIAAGLGMNQTLEEFSLDMLYFILSNECINFQRQIMGEHGRFCIFILTPFTDTMHPTVLYSKG